MGFFNFISRMCRSWRAFVSVMSEEPRQAETSDPQDSSQVAEAFRIAPEHVDAETQQAFGPDAAQLFPELGPLNKEETMVETVPLFDRELEVTRLHSTLIERPDGTLEKTVRQQRIMRADDGVPVTDVSQMYQCMSCQHTVTESNTYICCRCGVRYCRGHRCLNEVIVDGQVLQVCESCAKLYRPLISSPEFGNTFTRRLFDY